MNVHIRNAVVNDVEAIFDIRTSVKENYLSLSQLADLGITHETITDFVAESPCTWIAEIDGAPAGFSMADADEGNVFALFVRQDMEGRGLGTSLMEKVEDYLFARHETIWLTTERDSRASRFYAARGWMAVAEQDNGQTRFEKIRPK
ncbi:GNAT family N-acetyltransferase [Ochrobactrum sp. CM-21-5]|nr:GNAT family N-acetyltransferase [Ochrobactrum sp. CM-21-5]MBC2884460.1 GNAT family N-acetyltransferase [Ochrobactrum sp. CM-21-5]